MGLPYVVTTDQGTKFRNTLNSEMMSTFGIKHRFMTAYHPQVTVRLYIYVQIIILKVSYSYTFDHHPFRRMVYNLPNTHSFSGQVCSGVQELLG